MKEFVAEGSSLRESLPSYGRLFWLHYFDFQLLRGYTDSKVITEASFHS
jgi:hypothetical protein